MELKDPGRSQTSGSGANVKVPESEILYWITRLGDSLIASIQINRI